MITRPMLAAKVETIDTLRYPLLASPKLDGIRAMVINGVLLSRSMKPIPNRYLQASLGLNALNGLDGELCAGLATSSSVFRDTTSAVMTQTGEPEVQYHVFDFIGSAMEHFQGRLELAQNFAGKHPLIKVVPHTRVHNSVELIAMEQEYLAAGYEGIMLRSLTGRYKQGRSTLSEGWLMKLKRFMDSEAVIVDVIELQHNRNEAKEDERGYMKRSSHQENKVAGDKLGSLSVKDAYTGVQFEIGTGFSDGDRHAYWQDREKLIGKTVKYRFFPSGSKDRPRFPTFLGFRAVDDI